MTNRQTDSHFFAHRSNVSAYAFHGLDNLKNCPLPLRDLDPLSSTWFLGSTTTQTGISIGSAVFTKVTNRQTDRPTTRPRYTVCSNSPYLTQCMRCGLITIFGNSLSDTSVRLLRRGIRLRSTTSCSDPFSRYWLSKSTSLYA